MIHNPPSAKSSLVCSNPASGRAPRRLRLLLRITSSSLFRRKGKTLGAENAWKITRFPAVRANIMPPESVGASSEGGGMVGIYRVMKWTRIIDPKHCHLYPPSISAPKTTLSTACVPQKIKARAADRDQHMPKSISRPAAESTSPQVHC